LDESRYLIKRVRTYIADQNEWFEAIDALRKRHSELKRSQNNLLAGKDKKISQLQSQISWMENRPAYKFFANIWRLISPGLAERKP